ncbi:XRE family transcriptional regulator [Pantoea rodasii]|uniref:XRE family transcriptional regulator n=1 Tax=Pantoea rodasii TaxID=1076549 RepID=UPI000FFC2120|nr:XRE family transcriptional regulator [Pantoea rodasii]
MNLKILFENLPETDKQKMVQQWMLNARSGAGAIREPESQGEPVMSMLAFSALPHILASKLKQQNITYEEMAMQIGVSISTFKRMMARPSAAKAINLHALLKELGMKVWLER